MARSPAASTSFLALGDAMERYAPQFVIRATGEEAVRRLQSALREGKEVELPEGAEVTFTRLPPAMSDMVGERLTGTVKLGPAERPPAPTPPPWQARLRAETDRASAQLDVEFRAAATPPEGWDGALVGTRGGLTVTAMFRRSAAGGHLSWNFRYSRDESRVRDQLAALKLFNALCGSGELVVTDRGGSGRPVCARRFNRSPPSTRR